MIFNQGQSARFRFTRSLTTAILMTVLLGLPGCHRHGTAAPQATGAVKTYKLKGTVASTDEQQGEVIVNSEAIPGFMDAMTMPYKVKDPGILQDLHPGDKLTADLLLSDTSSMLDHIVVTQQTQPDYKPASEYHVPAPGDLVPDFHFVNQDGKQVDIDQYRGKALLITFIYTRCPLSDYCPRMSRNFASIQKIVENNPALASKTHLLSISFDPAYDTPEVLRSYGGGYTGRYTNETFKDWEFVAPPADELKMVSEFFDVAVTPEKDKTITHSLSTVLIAPNGKVAAWYPTNDWTITDVVTALQKSIDASNAAQGQPS